MPRTRTPLAKIRVHVYLRRPDADGFYATRMVAHFHNTRLHLATGVRVKPEGPGKKGAVEKWWDADSGRLTPKHPDVNGRTAAALNGTLQHWQERVEAAFWKLAGPHGYELVTTEMMESELFPRAEKKESDPRTLTFAEHHAAWVSENKGIFSASTIRQQAHVPAELERYVPGCRAGDMNEKFVRGYIQYLLAKNMADSAIYNHFKLLRIVARRIGIDPKAKWMTYASATPPQLDLEADELRRLLAVRLEEAPLQRERDRWLLECFTCRRDSDMKTLGPQQLTTITTIAGDVVTALRHTMQKVAKEVLVPLPPVAVAIGERYGWCLPVVTNQVRNELIKEVAKRAGLTRMFNDQRISGGKSQENYRPVYEIITTHTARHTGASLLLEGSDGDKSVSEYMLGHGIKTNTDIYAKDKARRVTPKVLAAWKVVLGEWYEPRP